MSLRYGRLFDSTVRDEYERALDLAKQRIGAMPPTTGEDLDDGVDWRTTPTIKTALAGGYCLRAPAQGACSYANICENCTSFHTTRTHLPVLQAQRDDARALADDAQSRGWDPETERLTTPPAPDQPSQHPHGPHRLTTTETGPDQPRLAG